MPARMASSASGNLPQGAGGRSSAEGARGAFAARGAGAALAARAGLAGGGPLRGRRPPRFFFELLLNGRQPPG